MKNTIIVVGIIIVLIGGYFLFQRSSDIAPVTETENEGVTPSPAPSPESGDGMQVEKPASGSTTVLGTSIEKRDITAYHFGTGDAELLFIGGIHGGYSWNTALVAYEMIDYLKTNPAKIPANVRVTVIPVLNPDGLNKVVGTTNRFTAADVKASAETQVSGRFNGRAVDINRNFDCDWQPTGTWQSKTVSGGSAAFSEPESMAVKAYVEKNKPAAALIWFSAAGGVFSSTCGGSILPETSALTNLYAKASGYPAHESFDFYETTGDVANWLAKMKIPAVSVLLTTHTDVEWSKNQAGIEAFLKHFAQ